MRVGPDDWRAAFLRDTAAESRTVVFLAFSGEELGLLGSAHYVKHPRLPLAKCSAMLNLDMVGRSKEGYCAVGAIGSSPAFKGLPEKRNAAQGLGLKLECSDGGMAQGSSDHQSFLDAGVPSLFFFSGLHDDYHKPGDDTEKINADGAARIATLCLGVLDDVIALPQPPKFTPLPAVASTRPSASGRPWFGSKPSFGEAVDGVVFDGTSPGSPAEKAGIVKGDKLVEWNGRPVKTLEDFTALLGAAKVGDVVKVGLLRDGKRVDLELTLALRPQ